MQSQPGTRSRSGELAPDLRMFERWTLYLFGASVLFHVFCYAFLHVGPRTIYPLAQGRDRFYDFTIFTDKFKAFHTPQFWSLGFPINYPAPCIVFYEFFFRYMTPHALLAFETFCVLAFVIPAVLLARALRRFNIATWRAARFAAVITLFSWPAVLLVDGGNVEVTVWVALLLGMWAYSTGRLWMAAGFLGLGTSLKLFPFVLLGLFLWRKQYSKILFGAVTFLVVSLVCMAVVGPTIQEAYRGILYGLTSFRYGYMAVWRPGENGVDHSGFALVKLIGVKAFHHSLGFRRTLSVYLALTAISGLLLYILRIRKLPLLNQVLVLTIASIYFTAFSGDGTLIHLYYPCVMMFFLAQRAWQAGIEIPGLRLMLGCLVFCLSFESFLIHHEQRFIGPAHCIGVGLLLFAALKYPLGPPLTETPSETILSDPSFDRKTWMSLANSKRPSITSTVAM
jgi:hypothetical protein